MRVGDAAARSCPWAVNHAVRRRADSERGQLAQPSEAAGGGQASGGQGSGLDYHLAFSQACVPMAITSVDGRFLDCNHLYLHFSGFGRSELLQKSMFTLTHPEDMQRTFR